MQSVTPWVGSVRGQGASGRATAEGIRERSEATRVGRARLSLRTAVVLALTIGVCAGYLDAGLIVFKKFFLNPEGYFRIARDFPWSVPVGHAALLLVPGLLLAVLGRLFPRVFTVGVATWLLATLGIWGALLRLPMYGWCSLMLAAGFARPIAGVVAGGGRGSRRVRFVPAGALALLLVLAAATTGREAIREYRTIAALPAPPRARNVVMIVWDTVRARSLTLYGYEHNTTPNLARLAAKGVAYHDALAPAPWTFPSHAGFFTGLWPMEVDSQWNPRLDTPHPTLAEYLAARGYQTAAFMANTNSLTYETGLARGFVHLEGYATDPATLLARTVPGQWLLQQALEWLGDYRRSKWIGLQSRDAASISESFLGWLGHRRADRPFFAFLNYFDAHDAYIAPEGFAGRFGHRPGTPKDYRFLLDYVGSDKTKMTRKEFRLAYDSYEDCIAYLDDQLGRVMSELERRGLLADTDVIVTSDHGEAFAEHGVLTHGFSTYSEELRVPLVMLGPGVPTGEWIVQPVSLRDLPATVVDRVGLASGSPFPGRSLADFWGLPPGRSPSGPLTPAFSEQACRSARMLLRPQAGRGGTDPGFQMSLVAWNFHYIRDGEGVEQLYDLTGDPNERGNMVAAPDRRAMVAEFRAMLLGVLDERPGSPAVEATYLRAFREALRAQVRGATAGEGKVASRGAGRGD